MCQQVANVTRTDILMTMAFDITYELGRLRRNEACGSFLIRFYCRLEKSLTANCAGLAFGQKNL